MNRSCRLLTALFVTRTDDGAIDLHWLLWLVSVNWRLVDRVNHFHAFRHRTERSKLAVEMRCRGNEDEKMRRRAVWLLGARHRDDAANVFDEAGLVGQLVRHAFREHLAPLLTRL